MVVCGICALFVPLKVHLSTLKKEFPFSVGCAALLLILGYLGMELGRTDGILMLVIFAAYLVWMILSAKRARTEADGPTDDDFKNLPVWKMVVFIIGGAIAIKYGGDFVVDGASVLAAKAGMSQTLIGLTVVAFGTSLPELVTSIVAAKKNEVDMAVGNVVGSNIFNILLVLGVAGSISPITFLMDNLIDIVILIGMSILVWIFAWRTNRIRRGEGVVMLLLYAAYVIYIILR